MSALLVADLPIPDVDLHVVVVAHRHQVLQVGREGLQKCTMIQTTVRMLLITNKFVLVCKLIEAF